MYKRLMSSNDKPVSWNCEDEYANDFPETTTEIHTQTTGTWISKIVQILDGSTQCIVLIYGNTSCYVPYNAVLM